MTDWPVLPSGWPPALRDVERFLPWQGRVRPSGRLAKVPIGWNGVAWVAVDARDPAHWQGVEEAAALVRSGRASGVGLCLTPDVGWVGVDLDHCRSPEGELTVDARRVMADLPGTYVEASPSGRGVHLLVPGTLPDGWRRAPGVDLVTNGFLTVTGEELRAGVLGAAVDLAGWHARHAPVQLAVAGRPSARRHSSVADPEGVLRRASRARNGARFGALWAGGRCGYRSRSEGDLALMMMLLYWLGDPPEDTGVVDCFLASGRARDGLTPAYLSRTLATARAYRAGGAGRPG
ncbi:hypothetical protein [Deinococcus enclensis]|uniref:Primase-polymerase (Primpol)-like protein n=1 Tax=Deinococcus enclensis TaxID=1049582 RepID=A0ABT9MI63_9DEIO|nr:hypothetical protein [Deinococcus enclensis]MDP9766279.1 primase-polymerase (primpol)-like protein [Deinococcus enclensis]